LPAWLTAHARAVLANAGPSTVLGQTPHPLPPHPTRPDTQARLLATAYCRDFAATIAAETTGHRAELRFPLFDTRVVQLVMSIPAIPWCQHKLLPRRAYRGRLPHGVLARPKTTLAGFDDALVRTWRASGAAVAGPGDSLADWVDVALWRRVLQEHPPSVVMPAWRVLALDAWIAGVEAGTPLEGACIR
jgi:hypothetical protein